MGYAEHEPSRPVSPSFTLFLDIPASHPDKQRVKYIADVVQFSRLLMALFSFALLLFIVTSPHQQQPNRLDDKKENWGEGSWLVLIRVNIVRH